MDEPLLSVCGLQKRFLSGGAEIRAVDGVSFSIGRGELFGLVGESGSGKSTVARCVAGLCRPEGGEIRLAGSFQMIFQDASGSLNPRMTAEELICEPLDILRRGGRAERRERARELLGLVGLGEELAGCFPEFAEFSGNCRFTGCSHTVEKGCAVLEALREGKIHPSRHASYRALYEDAKKLKEWELKDPQEKK